MTNEEIFAFLEQQEQLPKDFSQPQTYYFDADTIFYLVVYTSAKEKREFRLFSVNDFQNNKTELQELPILMEEEYSKTQNDIYLKAQWLIEDYMRTLSAQNFFFDAH